MAGERERSGRERSAAESRAGSAAESPPDSPAESPELEALRRRIDELDRRIVGLLNERARLGLEVGRAKLEAGRRTVRDGERERDVLTRVALANEGPLPQGDLLAVYRRLVRATRELEERERAHLEP